jgi:Asp-tRNA(Asn)/Glu-tRNA(Gln) amidotransferase A subunit family amidase
MTDHSTASAAVPFATDERGRLLATYLAAAADFFGLPDIDRVPVWAGRMTPNLDDLERLLATPVATQDDPVGLPVGADCSGQNSQGVGRDVSTVFPEGLLPGRTHADMVSAGPDDLSVETAPLVRLARRIATGDLDPVAHVQRRLDAIAARPELNAFIHVDAQDALAKARTLKAQIAAGMPVGLLAGTVMAVKDCFPVKGLPYQAGSAAVPVQVASASALAVQRLEAAGAIVIGMTNMHELSYGGLSNNPHFGAVGHPQNPEFVPGGSSGGSAVAVAADMADFALGTDAAGSVRMPAALCGLVGFKASYDRVPRDGVVPLTWSLDHIGPLTRTVADAAVVTAMMAGEGAAVQQALTSSASLASAVAAGVVGAEPMAGAATSPPARALTVFCPENYFDPVLEPDVRAVFQQTLAVLQSAGVLVQQGIIPELELAPMLQYFTMAPEAAQVHDALALQHPDRIGDDVRARLEAGRFIRAVDYLKAQRLRTALKRALTAPLQAGAQVMVTPTVLTAACRADAVVHRADRAVAVRTVLTRLTYPFNLTGMPAISVPCGVNAAGLPVGLHIAGRCGDDATVLAVAAHIEAVLGQVRNAHLAS